MSACPRTYLRFEVIGGLNNQRECIQNGAIAAHSLGIGLLLPSVALVGHGNERFAPADASYQPPFDSGHGRSRWVRRPALSSFWKG